MPHNNPNCHQTLIMAFISLVSLLFPPQVTPQKGHRRPIFIMEEEEEEEKTPMPTALSLDEMKARVRASLRDSGAVDSILAQLRGHLLRPLAMAKEDQHRQQQHAQDYTSRLPLETVVLNSLVVDFLQHQKCLQSLAIFLPESHMLAQQKVLSRADLAQALGMADEQDKEATRRSLLHALLLRQSKEPEPPSPPSSSRSITATQTNTPAAAQPINYEERLRRFQSECEARAQRDVAAEMTHFRETELTHLRLEEAAKHRRELLMLREELQHDYKRRVDQATARAREEERRVQARLQAGATAQFEARQALLRDMGVLRHREEEHQRTEALASKRHEALDKRERALAEQAAAWATQRAAEVEAARKEGTRTYAAQLQTLQTQQRFLQEELRKVHDERVAYHEHMGELSSLRREVEDLRARVGETDALRKEKERWAVERERLQRQEQEAWDHEQAAVKEVRELERAHAGLEMENEKLRRQAEEDEVELVALREEGQTLRGLLTTSRKTLDCLQHPTTTAAGARPVPLSLPAPSVPPSVVVVPPPVPLPLPTPLVGKIVGGGENGPTPHVSLAFDMALHAYETEVRKLKDVHDELLVRRGGGGGGSKEKKKETAEGGAKERREGGQGPEEKNKATKREA